MQERLHRHLVYWLQIWLQKKWIQMLRMSITFEKHHSFDWTNYSDAFVYHIASPFNNQQCCANKASVFSLLQDLYEPFLATSSDLLNWVPLATDHLSDLEISIIDCRCTRTSTFNWLHSVAAIYEVWRHILRYLKDNKFEHDSLCSAANHYLYPLLHLLASIWMHNKARERGHPGQNASNPSHYLVFVLPNNCWSSCRLSQLHYDWGRKKIVQGHDTDLLEGLASFGFSVCNSSRDDTLGHWNSSLCPVQTQIKQRNTKDYARTFSPRWGRYHKRTVKKIQYSFGVPQGWFWRRLILLGGRSTDAQDCNCYDDYFFGPSQLRSLVTYRHLSAGHFLLHATEAKALLRWQFEQNGKDFAFSFDRYDLCRAVLSGWVKRCCNYEFSCCSMDDIHHGPRAFLIVHVLLLIQHEDRGL